MNQSVVKCLANFIWGGREAWKICKFIIPEKTSLDWIGITK